MVHGDLRGTHLDSLVSLARQLVTNWGWCLVREARCSFHQASSDNVSMKCKEQDCGVEAESPTEVEEAELQTKVVRDMPSGPWIADTNKAVRY